MTKFTPLCVRRYYILFKKITNQAKNVPPEKIRTDFCVLGRSDSLSERRNDSVKRANAVKVIESAINAIISVLKLFTDRSRYATTKLSARDVEPGGFGTRGVSRNGYPGYASSKRRQYAAQSGRICLHKQ